jgi:hypothetical protein
MPTKWSKVYSSAQSDNTLTRIFLKHALLIWPGIGGCPCRAKVPCGSQILLVGSTCSTSALGIVYSITVKPNASA